MSVYPSLWMEGAIHNHKLLIWRYRLEAVIDLAYMFWKTSGWGLFQFQCLQVDTDSRNLARVNSNLLWVKQLTPRKIENRKWKMLTLRNMIFKLILYVMTKRFAEISITNSFRGWCWKRIWHQFLWQLCRGKEEF